MACHFDTPITWSQPTGQDAFCGMKRGSDTGYYTTDTKSAEYRPKALDLFNTGLWDSFQITRRLRPSDPKGL